jgi:hypothetical protein
MCIRLIAGVIFINDIKNLMILSALKSEQEIRIVEGEK